MADPSHTYTTVGAKAVSLTVTDDDGATDTATTTIQVDPNLSPTAAASATPTSGKLPLVVAFSSAGSSDPDGSIASYAWTFGDGGTSAAADPSHTYASAGLYTAELTVTDDNGSTDTATVSVQVNANQAPTAVASLQHHRRPGPADRGVLLGRFGRQRRWHHRLQLGLR